ncbi:uncharacterized [Tachysurus ichikawai]
MSVEVNTEAASLADLPHANRVEESMGRGAGADNRYQPGIDRVQQSPRNTERKHRSVFTPGGHGKVRQAGLHPHHPTTAFTTVTIVFTLGV